MMIMIMANTKFQTSSITISFKGGSQCDVHRLVLPSLGQHRQLRQGAAVLQGCLHPHPNHPPVVFMLILILICVHQFIKNSCTRLSSSSSSSHFYPRSHDHHCSGLHPHAHPCSPIHQEHFCKVVFFCIIMKAMVLVLILVDQLIKSIIIAFPIPLVITIILMISVHNLDDQRSQSRSSC